MSETLESKYAALLLEIAELIRNQDRKIELALSFGFYEALNNPEVQFVNLLADYRRREEKDRK